MESQRKTSQCRKRNEKSLPSRTWCGATYLYRVGEHFMNERTSMCVLLPISRLGGPKCKMRKARAEVEAANNGQYGVDSKEPTGKPIVKRVSSHEYVNQYSYISPYITNTVPWWGASIFNQWGNLGLSFSLPLPYPTDTKTFPAAFLNEIITTKVRVGEWAL